MTVTQHLMRPGSGSVRFRADTPISAMEAIRRLVDENFGGDAVGAAVVITPTHIDGDGLSDDDILDKALFAGPITARPSRLSVEFTGWSAWLDTYIDSSISRSAGTPTQWLGDLLGNGLTSGTISGGSNVSRTFPAHSATRRQCLDTWASLAGLEYRVNADLTVDVATSLFVTPPQAIVARHSESAVAELRGVDGSLLDQALTELGPSLCTKAVALAEGDGPAIAKGTATQSLNLKTPGGGSPSLVTVFSAPSEESANANTAASSFLNLQGMRRAVNVSSRTHALPRYVKPGDEVYVFDLESGLYDDTNPVQYDGRTVFPITVRLLSYTWPVEQGMGVYIRPNAASPSYIDVTDWVEWEVGQDTFWTVGDWNPPSYGPVNRSNPEIEERVAGIGVGTNITGVTAATGWGSVTLDYCRRVGPMMFFRINATRTGGNLSAGNVTNEVVCTLTGTGATGNFSTPQPIAAGNNGPTVSGVYDATSGEVTVTAAATGVNTSDPVSFGGCVLIDA